MRDYGDKFDLLSYLGTNTWTMKKEYMCAHKLVALTDRKRTDKSTIEYFKYLLEFIPEKFHDNALLYGLGEFISEDQKKYVKKDLKRSIIQHLNVYLELNKN